MWAGKLKMSSNRRADASDLFNRVDTCEAVPPPVLPRFLPALERGKMEDCTYREINPCLFFYFKI